MSQYGDPPVSFTEARKRVFIIHLTWGFPTVDDMEFDQSATPFAKWVVIHEFGQILGGVRLMPTTAKCGVYAYMLRAAPLGLLDPIPGDVLLPDAPADPKVWEAARLFITKEVPATRRARVQGISMAQMAVTVGETGAIHVIGIVAAVFSRGLRRLELAAVPVGRRFQIDATRSQPAPFKVAQTLHCRRSRGCRRITGPGVWHRIFPAFPGLGRFASEPISAGTWHKRAGSRFRFGQKDAPGRRFCRSA